MLVISEREARALVSMSDGISVMESAFQAVFAGSASSYPVVRESLQGVGGVFGVKSGANLQAGILGLKAGGYWQGNEARGMTNHQSATVLFDQETGTPQAFVSANYLTGLRTAAVAGLASRYLARSDASVLGIIGAGGQALFQIEAARSVRNIERILLASRTEARALELRGSLQRLGIDYVSVVSAEVACAEADIITTVTPATAPVVRAEWVRPGTHINAMGADTRGKQEIDPALMQVASVFVDDWKQAASIGECQHGAADGALNEGMLAGTLGDLASSRHLGRRSADEITVFDSTGMAIQDLAVAHFVVERARRMGLGQELALHDRL